MRSIRYIFIFTFLAISVSSQELDKSFLESLPKDIQDDVLKRAQNQGEDIQQNYSSFQYSSKLDQTEELFKLKKRIELDLLELERRLNSDENLDIDEELKLFGLDFFKSFQTSFMPINEPNPDSSYTLDV
mgnify:FL=1